MLSSNNRLKFMHQRLIRLLPQFKRVFCKNISAIWPFRKKHLWPETARCAFTYDDHWNQSSLFRRNRYRLFIIMWIDSFCLAKHRSTTKSLVLVLATEFSRMQSAEKWLKFWPSSQFKPNFCAKLSARVINQFLSRRFSYWMIATLLSKSLIGSSERTLGTRKLSLGAYWSGYTELSVFKTTISILSIFVSIDKLLSAEQSSVITFKRKIIALQTLRTELAKNNRSGLIFPLNKPAFLEKQWLHFIQQGILFLLNTLKKYEIVSSLAALSSS